VGPHDLRFEGVSLRLRGRPILVGVTLVCAAGEGTCLAGPNGAGKSTMLALAAGLLPASTGRIVLGDTALRAFAPSPRAAYLPQVSAFPPLLTAREVFEFARRARCADAHAGDEVLELTGLGTVLDRRVGELSGGWVRRLGLAVGLVGRADILLLDEPFAGLDPETLDRLVAHLARRTAAGATVVLASHDFDVVDATVRRVAVLEEGMLRGVFPLRSGARALYRQVLGSVAGDGRRDAG
jgi:ABC-type multidrug transport system ATPase subunit